MALKQPRHVLYTTTVGTHALRGSLLRRGAPTKLLLQQLLPPSRFILETNPGWLLSPLSEKNAR